MRGLRAALEGLAMDWGRIALKEKNCRRKHCLYDIQQPPVTRKKHMKSFLWGKRSESPVLGQHPGWA